MSLLLLNIFLILWSSGSIESPNNADKIYIRINQLGYLPGESKTAIAFSHTVIKENFLLVSEDSKSTMKTRFILTIISNKYETQNNNKLYSYDYFIEL